MKTIERTLGVVLVLALGLNCALANTAAAPTAEDAVADAASPAAIAPVKPESVPDAKASARTFGEGMQIPVDGTSLVAFEQSLETIKDKTTKDEFMTLTNAIDYLLVYQLEAKRDRAKLAVLLDGMTGAEIVDMVAWNK